LAREERGLLCSNIALVSILFRFALISFFFVGEVVDNLEEMAVVDSKEFS